MRTSADAARVIKRMQITYFSRATAFYRESVPGPFRVCTRRVDTRASRGRFTINKKKKEEEGGRETTETGSTELRGLKIAIVPDERRR